jgi:hypothetical protein
VSGRLGASRILHGKMIALERAAVGDGSAIGAEIGRVCELEQFTLHQPDRAPIEECGGCLT